MKRNLQAKLTVNEEIQMFSTAKLTQNLMLIIKKQQFLLRKKKNTKLHCWLIITTFTERRSTNQMPQGCFPWVIYQNCLSCFIMITVRCNSLCSFLSCHVVLTQNFIISGIFSKSSTFKWCQMVELITQNVSCKIECMPLLRKILWSIEKESSCNMTIFDLILLRW